MDPATRVTRALDTAREAGIDAETTSRLLGLGFDAGIGGAEMGALLDFLVLAKRQGFGPSLFMAKIEEGLAKRVSTTRILEALDRRRDAYILLRSLAGPSAASDDPTEAAAFERLVDSLDAGLARETLSRILRQADRKPMAAAAMAAEMSALLQQLDFAPVQRERIVQACLDYGPLDASWGRLPHLAAIALKRGIAADAIVQAAVAQMRRGGTPGDVRAALGFTGRDLRQAPGIKESD